MPSADAPYTRVPGELILPAIAFVPDRDGDGHAEIALTVQNDGPSDQATRIVAIHIISSVSAAELMHVLLPVYSPGSHGDPWVLRTLLDHDGTPPFQLLVSMATDYVLVLSGLDGKEQHRHDYEGHYLEGEGTSLDCVGDLDADGLSDYLVAANEDGMDCDPGFVQLRSGADGRALASLGFDYDDTMSDGNCGAGVDACAIGDANGDGISDIAVHMPRLREARVLSGKDLAVITTVDLSELEPLEQW